TGIFLWACVLKSGVHATCAGVILGLFIPIKIQNNKKISPLKKLENNLYPWVSYGILPIFAFANAGVSFEGLTFTMLQSPITLGIASGLFFGKQIGVMSMSALAIILKLANLPPKVNWLQFYGLALITGIGFTMSLFIGTLAFYDLETQAAVRLGVLIGSLFSAILGCIIIVIANKRSIVPSIQTGTS
ncbi:MAG TPA: Na+/H+ antiporter NhaA, partial [Gammaproteobacteria bacterium]|nr:Na+/H+ antiporter NhaA [Gammaproteobacteria bacterium]